MRYISCGRRDATGGGQQRVVRQAMVDVLMREARMVVVVRESRVLVVIR
jgi:hypothetical protein